MAESLQKGRLWWNFEWTLGEEKENISAYENFVVLNKLK